MKTITLSDWENASVSKAGVTIGNFDGVHLGHRGLLGEFKQACLENGLTPHVFTFNPHPAVYFHPGKPHLLTSYRQKRELLRAMGFENIVEIDFGAVRNMTGGEFARRYLAGAKDVRLLWTGHDFTFGRDKAPAQTCARQIPRLEIQSSKPFKIDGRVVSSSLVRKLLSEGRTELANKRLGRPFSVEGTVVRGKRMGRQIGFPTINLQMDYPCCAPRYGVYAVICEIEGEKRKGMINVGVNPTVDSEDALKWEAHLFDFDRDVYGANARIELIHFLRPEKKFGSLEELAGQIKADARAAEVALG